MRRAGTPITIRVDADVLKLCQLEAKTLKKPLCTHLREIVEGRYRIAHQIKVPDPKAILAALVADYKRIYGEDPLKSGGQR
jgi:hypothetical protein